MVISDIKKVCVAGGGQMGRQIALNAAINGFDVYVTDSIPAVLEAVNTWAEEYLKGRVKKGKMTEGEVRETLSRFHTEPDLKKAAGGAQLVIEAIIEDKDVKTEFFKQLDKVVSKDAIIASNSSYMPSSTFKDCVTNPKRLTNLHFFIPTLVMKPVEVVKGEHTSQETIDLVMEFARANKKVPILVKKEIDGFVVNRILRATRDEAFYLVEQGICTPQDLDTAVELGLGHVLGPFKVLDLAGIDINYLSGLKRWKDTGVKPNGFDIVKAKYEAGELGRKTGRGFYTYDKK